jgi:type IV pilus assembly protein PilB
MLITEKQLEKILVGGGYVKKPDFDIVKDLAKKENIPLDKMIVEEGLVQDEVMGKLIAKTAGYPYIKLKRAIIEDITPQMLSYIPEKVAYAQKAIVFAEDEKKIKVASNDPSNYSFFKTLEKKVGKKVEVYYATIFDIDQALGRYRGNIALEIEKLIQEIKEKPKKIEENVVKITDLILDYGYTTLASDIHLEPLAKSVIGRYRIDGLLYKILEYPKDLHIRIASRLKILARLRTDEREAPQDGRFTHIVRGAAIDIRISVMPTAEGENVVMRLLMQRGRRLKLEQLGLLLEDLKKLKRNIAKPYGMIVAAGPTGCGKTTTLYALIDTINLPEVNIMTIEDPIEYRIERVRQIQVNPAKGITFASGLRSIVRQDPDIIMVGEMRDKETIDIAINSALTGHLVLTTLHANDAPTTFSRFLEMGAKSYLVSACVNAVIGQRLVRKVCDNCRQSYFLSKEERATLKEERPELLEVIKEIAGEKDIGKIKFYKGKGCKFCDQTGYEGRTAIFEVLDVTAEIRELVTNKASMDAIRKEAIRQGMTTMVQDGIIKALTGITTLEEVKRATKFY